MSNAEAEAKPETLKAPAGGFSGSCACGNIKYLCTELPEKILNCYCEKCRKQSGGPYMSYATVNTKSLEWKLKKVRVGEKPKLKIIVDGRKTRTHCTSCRSPLSRQDDVLDGKTQIVRTSIDDCGPDAARWSDLDEETVMVHGAPAWVKAPNVSSEEHVFSKRSEEYGNNVIEHIDKMDLAKKRKSGVFSTRYSSRRVSSIETTK